MYDKNASNQSQGSLRLRLRAAFRVLQGRPVIYGVHVADSITFIGGEPLVAGSAFESKRGAFEIHPVDSLGPSVII